MQILVVWKKRDAFKHHIFSLLGHDTFPCLNLSETLGMPYAIAGHVKKDACRI